ncbi:FAD-dependent oxidoreductase [uncultured Kushneria sp.]|uniref:NAD(P)/FAD-dependent oxidoreductase n=1 Tax=uncultured Kushneria sp. TaxID=905033 RepID=UPI002612B5B1|nr:FAD-dependent oxidoreductase [uncultured Kushneria sp.]
MDFLHNIAVVGAGMAGLAAARALQQAGRSVQIFDKGRRPGGRMSSRCNAHGLFDLGAQYFTVRDPDFAKVITHCEKLGVVARWPDLMACHVDGQWQSRHPEHPRYSGVPSMAALTDALAESLEIHQQVRITSITRTGSTWRLEDQNGRLWSGFDHVIVAIPAPQAAQLLHEVATSLLPLPGMSSCWSTWVRFEDTLAMPEGIDTWQGAFLKTSPMLRWAARNQTRPGQHGGERITLLANDDWSDRHLEADPDQVADEMIEAFRQCYPVPLPAVKAQGAHRWRYAQPRRPTEHTAGYLVDMSKGLSLCGDWCIDGRVEAAWQSGNRLAQALCRA